MKKVLYYLYLGENGTLLTPTRFDNVPSVKKYRLISDSGKRITKDGVHFYDEIMVPESEAAEWYEINAEGQG